MKKIDLILALEDLGDDMEVYIADKEGGEFEIAEVQLGSSGSATIIAGDER